MSHAVGGQYRVRTHLTWPPLALIERGLCAEGVRSGLVDPEDWFPPERSRSKQWAQAAWQMCSACPVRARCLEYGRTSKSEGVWGGHLFYRLGAHPDLLGEYALGPQDFSDNGKRKELP